MEQLQRPSPQAKPNAIERSAGKFLKLCSWGWGIWAICGGLLHLSRAPFLSSLCILLGIVMIPPVRRLLSGATGFRPPHPIAPLTIGAAILATILVIGSRLNAEQKAEQQRLAQIAEVRERRESAFIASYPYVDRDALRAWQASAADSTTDSSKTLASFLEGQKAFNQQRIADSVRLERESREYAIAREREWRQDSIDRVIQARRDALLAARAATVPAEVELDIDLDLPKKSRSRKGYRKSSSSSSSYSSRPSRSYSSRSYSSSGGSSSGRSGRRGGRRR